MSGDTIQETLGAYISTDDIVITGLNPRKDFNKDRLEELASSIGKVGVLEPLVVRKGPKKTYELIAGERRHRAALMVGLEKVPVIVKELNDEQVREVMLMENLQREDLKPLEEANALSALLEMGLSREDLADRIGMSSSWVAGRIRLLKLPKEILSFLEEGRLGVEHAMSFVPYVDWPVIDALVKDVTQQFEGYYKQEDLSKHDVKHLIDLQLRNGKQTTDLDSFGYMMENREAKTKLFHKGGECKKCQAHIKHNGIDRLCLNPKCFRKKMRAVNKTFKEKEQKAAAKLKKSGKIELSKRAYGSFKVLKSSGWDGANFDIRTCNKCREKRVGVDAHNNESTVCIHPSCFDKKNTEVRMEKQRKAEEMQDLLKKNLDLVEPDDLVNFQSRLLRYLLFYHFDPAHKDEIEVIKPWAKRKPKKGWKVALSRIMDDDVPMVLLRLIGTTLVRSLNHNTDLAEGNSFKDVFPELFEGELPHKPEDLAEEEVTPEVPEDQPCDGLWTQDNDKGRCDKPNAPPGALCSALLDPEDAVGECPVKASVGGYDYTCPECKHEGSGKGKMPKRCPRCKGALW